MYNMYSIKLHLFILVVILYEISQHSRSFYKFKFSSILNSTPHSGLLPFLSLARVATRDYNSSTLPGFGVPRKIQFYQWKCIT